MGIKMAGLRFKLGALLVSTALSLVAAELFLRSHVSRFSDPKIFLAQPTDQSGVSPDERYNRIYETFQTEAPFTKTDIEIVTVGDSFTNGGNVGWRESYPYYLFENLGKTLSVRNFGLCEDTTKGSYIRLTDHFQRQKNAKSVVILLVGAADFFFDQGLDFENFYRQHVTGGSIPSEVMNRQASLSAKLSSTESWLESLKVYKVTRFVASRMRSYAESQWKNLSASKTVTNFDMRGLEGCLRNKPPERESCMGLHYRALHQSIMAEYDRHLVGLVIDTVIRVGLEQPMLKELRIVEDLLLLLNTAPRTVAHLDLLFNLVTYATMQSRYDIQEDIISVIQSRYAQEREFVDSLAMILPTLGPDGIHRIYNPASIIEALEDWSKQYDATRELQAEYLGKIIDLVGREQGELILLTYPLPYRRLNETIRSAAAKNELQLVDIERLFQEQYERGVAEQDLIADWEHLTPAGYRLIADALREPVLSAVEEIRKRHPENIP
jgi:lysophospholipase L1-like esterase